MGVRLRLRLTQLLLHRFALRPSGLGCASFPRTDIVCNECKTLVKKHSGDRFQRTLREMEFTLEISTARLSLLRNARTLLRVFAGSCCFLCWRASLCILVLKG